MNVAVGFTTNYDMRECFQIGNRVRCVKNKQSKHAVETGEVIEVTKYLVIVQFSVGRESFSFYDYRRGKVRRE